MLYPYLPVVGFIRTIASLIPLPRQIRVRNVSTIALSFWLFDTCFIYSINPIIWAGNVDNSAPIWCDISTNLRGASIVGLPAATFCICKHLELISSGRAISADAGQLRWRKVFESLMCFALPCFWLFVYYCFQSSRLFIVENFGCFPAYFPSAVAIGIIFFLPLLLSVGTLIYGSIALCHLIKNRRIHSKLLTSHLISRDAALSSAQYYRLMAITMIFGTWGIVWFCIEIKYITDEGLVPLASWKVIHSTYSTIPTIVLGSKNLHNYKVIWWCIPAFAYVFFLLFATSPEVWSEYQKCWAWFRMVVLRHRLSEQSVVLSSLRTGSIPNHVLPIYIDKTITVVDGSESSTQSFKLPVDRHLVPSS